MIWADKNVRLCFPKLFCWLADHRANATIHAIASNHCPVCIVLVEKRGKYSETGYPRRSHADYITTYRESDALSLNEQGVKNINNALWSLIELNPLDLVRADILYNILLGVWTHMIDWIQDFLEHYERINVFDYVWRRLPPYPGFCVLTKSYRVVSQQSGKEIRNFAKVILGTFAAALRRTTNQPRLTGGQVQEVNKAILSVRSLTDFHLMTQYLSQTDQTISYLKWYLREFHETKNVFLRFRVGKKVKKAAAEAHKNLWKKQSQASITDLMTSEKLKLHHADGLQCQEWVAEILREEAHYNFPKIHLIFHYTEQIVKFGILGQFSTDIAEAMHKRFKDAYRHCNMVNATRQIITTYTRDHTFAMKDLTISAWTRIRKLEHQTPNTGIRLEEDQVYLRLQGKIDLGTVSSLGDLKRVTGLDNLKLATRVHLTYKLQGIDCYTEELLNRDIRAYCALQIPVPNFSREGVVLYIARCTGEKEFQQKARNDWIWVRKHMVSGKAQPSSLNRRIPERLNALFKITSRGTVYRLAHVTLL